MKCFGHDPYIPAWTVDRFNAKKIVCIPESGHWVPAEAPEKVASELAEFLAT
jgi:pimeloyl-ACP methyl ester carboxylesterase